MGITDKDSFKSMILSSVERLLSLEDRNANSPTFGCFDRDYWAWKFKDMQDACMQNGVYALALLWDNNFEENTYFKNERVLEWIAAGIRRWCEIQHKDGSFDQIFPHEHSYGATAFTLFYMLEAHNIVGRELPDNLKKKFMIGVKKAAQFIMNTEEKHGTIANHLCAAAAALFNYYSISGDNKAKAKSKEILSIVFHGQDEGWLPEYGGADPGYQTLALYYLAKYYLKSNDLDTFGKIKESVTFLSYFMHPTGSIGARYGSRRTEIIYPAGFSLLKEKIPLAKRISDICFNNPLSEHLVSLNSIDDANLVPLLVSCLETFILQTKTNIQEIPLNSLPMLPIEREPFSRFFKKAGIFIHNTSNYYAIVGVNSNGLLNTYDKNSKSIICDDYGYVAKTDKGLILSSQFLNPLSQAEVSDNTVIIKGALARVTLPRPTAANILILRILNLTFCRLAVTRELIKRLLVRILITKKAKSAVFLERSLKFFQDSICITDKLSKPPGLKITQLNTTGMLLTQHMGASSYFKKSQIHNLGLALKFDLDKFNRESKLEVSVQLR